MKIGEAQQLYREQVKEYQEQKASISKQLKNIQNRMQVSTDKKEQYESEAATLELTLNALDEKQQEYYDYLDQLADQYCAYWNATVAEQQADAAEEYAIDMGKIMEVARRIMKGAIVPASDEKKLMDFSFEMYQTAKNIGAIAQQQQKKKEKYDSLWGEEEEKEYDNPQEVAENAEAVPGAPEIVEVAEIMETASQM
ncbi:MAG: hypothetical protein NC412_00395 [Roseburia sp.]|nr:hypothetical protein [Roseburia sp.]MCM1277481.1 hypothetical protein [Robinsoniella sp.]